MKTEATHEPDLSWDIYWAMLFLQLETQLGIVCACLPTLNVFIKRYVKEPLSTRSFGTRSFSKLKSEKSIVEVHELERADSGSL